MSEIINELIHHSRMKQELMFQLLTHNSAFDKIPVEKLRAFARFSVIQIASYQAKIKRNKLKKNKLKKLYSDEDFNNILPILNDFINNIYI